VAGEEWIELSREPIAVPEVLAWVIQPGCGAVDLFCGTVRDHSEGRPGVEVLEYEAYETVVVPRFTEIAHEARRRWPEIGRLAIMHRVGRLAVGEISVVVAVSTPHRATAFNAIRWCIDTLKATVPIWKREVWDDGADWGLDAHELTDVADAGSAGR
jgi:molybdopterin synthase catalytic subunit